MNVDDSRGAAAPHPYSSPSEPAPSGPSLTARLDRLTRLTRSQWLWMPLLGFLSLGESAEIHVTAYAAPGLRNDWHLSLGQIGQLTSYSFLGMLIGVILGGRLSDSFGRKRVIVFGSLFYAAGSLLCAIAPNLPMLYAFRVLACVGGLAALSALLVYVVEMFPQAVRGRCQGLQLGIGLLAVPIVAFAARFIVPLDPGAWRWVFVVSAIGLLPAIVAQLVLPESARWLVARGHVSHAATVVDRLEREYPDKLPSVIDPAVNLAPMAAHSRPTQLFRGRTRRTTIVASLLMIFSMVGLYGFNSWVPTLLTERGYSTAGALTITSIFSVAPFIGALFGMVITDRWERKNIGLVLAVAIATAMLTFGFTGSYWALLISGFLVALLLQTSTVIVYGYLPEVFPTSLRNLGSGFANGLGRLANIGGALLIPVIFAALGFGGVFTTTAVLTLAAGLILGFFGDHTRNRKLEDISSETSEPIEVPTSSPIQRSLNQHE